MSLSFEYGRIKATEEPYDLVREVIQELKLKFIHSCQFALVRSTHNCKTFLHEHSIPTERAKRGLEWLNTYPTMVEMFSRLRLPLGSVHACVSDGSRNLSKKMDFLSDAERFEYNKMAF